MSDYRSDFVISFNGDETAEQTAEIICARINHEVSEKKREQLVLDGVQTTSSDFGVRIRVFFRKEKGVTKKSSPALDAYKAYAYELWGSCSPLGEVPADSPPTEAVESPPSAGSLRGFFRREPSHLPSSPVLVEDGFDSLTLDRFYREPSHHRAAIQTSYSVPSRISNPEYVTTD